MRIQSPKKTIMWKDRKTTRQTFAQRKRKADAEEAENPMHDIAPMKVRVKATRKRWEISAFPTPEFADAFDQYRKKMTWTDEAARLWWAFAITPCFFRGEKKQSHALAYRTILCLYLGIKYCDVMLINMILSILHEWRNFSCASMLRRSQKTGKLWKMKHENTRLICWEEENLTVVS